MMYYLTLPCFRPENYPEPLAAEGRKAARAGMEARRDNRFKICSKATPKLKRFIIEEQWDFPLWVEMFDRRLND